MTRYAPPMLSRRALLLLPPALGLSAAGCGGSISRIPPSMRHPLAGQPAPDFRAKSASSSEIVEVPGSPETTVVTVVDFWASWCEACILAMPAIERIYRRNRDQGVAVVGVNVDDEPQNALAMVMQLQTTFPIVIDHGRIQGAYDVGQIPTTFAIDRTGLVRWVGRDMRALEQAVDKLVAMSRRSEPLSARSANIDAGRLAVLGAHEARSRGELRFSAGGLLGG